MPRVSAYPLVSVPDALATILERAQPLALREMVDLRQAMTFGELEIGWIGPAEADPADVSTADLYE